MAAFECGVMRCSEWVRRGRDQTGVPVLVLVVVASTDSWEVQRDRGPPASVSNRENLAPPAASMASSFSACTEQPGVLVLAAAAGTCLCQPMEKGA